MPCHWSTSELAIGSIQILAVQASLMKFGEESWKLNMDQIKLWLPSASNKGKVNKCKEMIQCPRRTGMDIN